MIKKKLSVEDLISIQFLTPQDIELIFESAEAIKKNPADFSQALAGKTLALIFEKPSLRTRVTFDVGMTSMGGNVVFLDHTVLEQQIRGQAHVPRLAALEVHEVGDALQREEADPERKPGLGREPRRALPE